MLQKSGVFLNHLRRKSKKEKDSSIQQMIIALEEPEKAKNQDGKDGKIWTTNDNNLAVLCVSERKRIRLGRVYKKKQVVMKN